MAYERELEVALEVARRAGDALREAGDAVQEAAGRAVEATKEAASTVVSRIRNNATLVSCAGNP